MASQNEVRKPNEIDIKLGAKIRKLRRESGQTLGSFADKIGISYQQLQKYETGTNRITGGMIATCADILDVPIDHLFEVNRRGYSKGKPDDLVSIRAECFRKLNAISDYQTLEFVFQLLERIDD